ncbi:MAG: ATP-binding protein [Kofleriaceae bacterium]
MGTGVPDDPRQPDLEVEAPARSAFAAWELALDNWVRHAITCYVARRQARGELYEPGFSDRAVAVEELARLLQQPPNDPHLGPAIAARDARVAMWRALELADRALEGHLLWAHLARRFSLSDDELELLLLTYVATSSPALQRALRFAWNDFARKLPTAFFLWELARPERGETGLDRLTDLVHRSNLITYQLIELLEPYPSPLFAQVRLHPNVTEALGRAARDSLGEVRLVFDPGAPPEDFPASDPAVESLTWLVIGPSGSGRLALALDRADRLGHRLVTCRIDAARATAPDAVVGLVRGCIRDAVLLGAALHLEDAHHLQDQPGLLELVLDAVVDTPIPVSLALLASPRALTLFSRLRITYLAAPTRERRLEIWDEAVGAHVLPAEAQDLAARYPLTHGQIRRAVRDAAWRHQLPSPSDRARARADLLHEEARNVLHRDVQFLATPVVTRLTWDDMILPEDVVEQLWDIVRFVRHRGRVFDDWGFRAKFDYGTSVTTLMTGPPGTGKTMASALIARELGLEVYRVALPQIVSKWIGETEKNLEKIFDFCERHGVALLCDEADSLFGKRANVETAADKYANLETNFLLQRLEQFDGVAFLTTNLAKGIDEAFERRLRFRIEFPDPDAEMRERLWRSMLPRAAVVAPKINWKWLAETFELSGAYIKEAVLTAAFKAAERKIPIDTDLLCLGANTQYRKMGKLSAKQAPQAPR